MVGSVKNPEYHKLENCIGGGGGGGGGGRDTVIVELMTHK